LHFLAFFNAKDNFCTDFWMTLCPGKPCFITSRSEFRSE
jgi:hypothetical protein